MLGSVATRERLPLWALVSFTAVLGFVVSTFLAEAARSAALDTVVQQARDVGQVLTDTLSDKQLAEPVKGASYDKLAARIGRSVSSDGSSVGVTVWSSRGRILFSSLDKQLVGTTNREMRPLLTEMSNESGSYRIGESTVRAFVPVPRTTNDGVVLVQVDEPLAVVEAEVGDVWKMFRLAFGFGLTVSLLLLGLTFVSSVRRVTGRRDDAGGEDREPQEREAVPGAKAEPEIEQPETDQPVAEPAASEPATASFSQALETLEALQPDLGHWVHEHQGGPDEGPEDAAGHDESPHHAPVEDEVRQDVAPTEETPDGQLGAEELMRKRREEFKARAAEAEHRVKKLEAELQDAGSGPRSEQ